MYTRNELDEALIAEQGRYLSQKAIVSARRAFVGRQVYGSSITRVPHGTQTYSFDVRTGTSAARIDPKYPGQKNQDSISNARSNVNINCLHKEFSVDESDWQSSLQTGENLSSANSDELSYQVSLLEDTMLLYGTVLEGVPVNGLYLGAGNSETTNLGWGTPANIITSVNNALTLEKADHIYGPFNMVLNSAQETYASVPIGSGSMTYLDWIMKRLGNNGQPGKIFVTEAIADGTGLLVKANPIQSEFEYVIADDLQVELEPRSVEAGRGLFGRVFVNSVPVIHDANTICKLTDIGGS